jgi:bifunctional oligoribonuclease and PAP phosphatase NrnA
MRDLRILHELARALRESRRTLVTSHPNPDGDAIGCMAAALVALRRLGGEVVAYNPDPVPRRFRFLAGTSDFVTDLPAGPFEATLLLDCSDERFCQGQCACAERLGRLLVVDHHSTPHRVGDLVLRDPSAASVGVLLFPILEALGVEITLEIAEALFCSVMSDTGSFRYQNSNSEALRVAAALLERGVDPWRVASRLYEDRPRCEVELLGRVLQTLVVSEDGRAAALTVTPEMLDETGCTPDMVDGLINYARGVEGVEVAILLWPGPHGVHVSLRSRGSVDVSCIAQRFGGGGHRNAAGCTIEGELGTVCEGVFSAVQTTLDLHAE